MDILYLLDRLENLIASSRRMPLINQIILKEEEILNIVDQMRTAIPDEIKQARRIIQEKERILNQANSESTTLLSQAHIESERILQKGQSILENRERILKEKELQLMEKERTLIKPTAPASYGVLSSGEMPTYISNKRCPKCGVTSRVEDQYCGQCGSFLS